MVVVLPEPLGPRNPITSPASTRRVSSSTASLSPKRLLRPSVSITAPAAGGRRAAARRRSRRRRLGRRAADRVRVVAPAAPRRASSVLAAISAPKSAVITSMGRALPSWLTRDAEARPARRPVQSSRARAPRRPRAARASAASAHVDGAARCPLSDFALHRQRLVAGERAPAPPPTSAPAGRRAANSASAITPAERAVVVAERAPPPGSRCPSSVTRAQPRAAARRATGRRSA